MSARVDRTAHPGRDEKGKLNGISRRELFKSAAGMAAAGHLPAAPPPARLLSILLSQEIIHVAGKPGDWTVTLGINVGAGTQDGDKWEKAFPWNWEYVDSKKPKAVIWKWDKTKTKWIPLKVGGKVVFADIIPYRDAEVGPSIVGVAKEARKTLEQWATSANPPEWRYNKPLINSTHVQEQTVPSALIQQSRLLPIGVGPYLKLCVHVKFPIDTIASGDAFIAIPYWKIHSLNALFPRPLDKPVSGVPVTTMSEGDVFHLKPIHPGHELFTDAAIRYESNDTKGEYFDLTRWYIRNVAGNGPDSERAVHRNDWTIALEERTAGAFDMARIWSEALHLEHENNTLTPSSLLNGCQAALGAAREMCGGRQDRRRSDATRLATHLLALDLRETERQHYLRRADFLLRLDDARRDTEMDSKKGVETRTRLLNWLRAAYGEAAGTGKFGKGKAGADEPPNVLRNLFYPKVPTPKPGEQPNPDDPSRADLSRAKEYLDELDAVLATLKQGQSAARAAVRRWQDALSLPLIFADTGLSEYKYELPDRTSVNPDAWEPRADGQNWFLTLGLAGSITDELTVVTDLGTTVISGKSTQVIKFFKYVILKVKSGSPTIDNIWITPTNGGQPDPTAFHSAVTRALETLYPPGTEASQTAYATLPNHCLRSIMGEDWSYLAHFPIGTTSHRAELETRLGAKLKKRVEAIESGVPRGPLQNRAVTLLHNIAAETAQQAIPPEVDQPGLGVRPSSTAESVSFQVARVDHEANADTTDPSDLQRRAAGLLLFLRDGVKKPENSPWRTANGASVKNYSVIRPSPLDYTGGISRSLITYDCQPIAAPSPLAAATNEQITKKTLLVDGKFAGVPYEAPLPDTKLPPLVFRKDTPRLDDRAVIALVSNSGALPRELWRDNDHPGLLKEAKDWRVALDTLEESYYRTFLYQRTVAVGAPQVSVDAGWAKTGPDQLDFPPSINPSDTKMSHLPQTTFAWTPEPEHSDSEKPPAIFPLTREIDVQVIRKTAPLRRWWDAARGGLLRGPGDWTLTLPSVFLPPNGSLTVEMPVDSDDARNLAAAKQAASAKPFAAKSLAMTMLAAKVLAAQPLGSLEIARNMDDIFLNGKKTLPLTGNQTFIVRLVNGRNPETMLSELFVELQSEDTKASLGKVVRVPVGTLVAALSGAYLELNGTELAYLGEPQFHFELGAPPADKRTDPPCILLPLPSSRKETKKYETIDPKARGLRDRIVLQIHPPQLELETWDRWPHTFTDNSVRCAVWTSQLNYSHTFHMDGIFSSGADKSASDGAPRVDDPAPWGVLAELVTLPVVPGKCEPAPIILQEVLAWDKTGDFKNGAWTRGSHKIEICRTAAGSPVKMEPKVRKTEEDDSLTVHLPPGTVAELRLYTLVEPANAAYFAGTLENIAGSPFFPGSYQAKDRKAYRTAAADTTLYLESAEFELPSPEDLIQALDPFWDGNGLRVRLHKPGAPGAFRYIGSATVYWQNFRWNGYPLEEFPPLVKGAHHPPFPLIDTGGRLDADKSSFETMFEWDAAAFYGRIDDEVDRKGEVVRLAALASLGGAPLLTPTLGRPDPPMSYWRVRATLRSRYTGLWNLTEVAERTSRKVLSSKRMKKDQKDPWRRAAAAARVETVPPPAVHAILPVFRRVYGCRREVHFMAVLQDRGYAVGGLAEFLAPTIDAAIRRALPGSAAQRGAADRQEIGRNPAICLSPIDIKGWTLIAHPPFGHTQDRDPSQGPFQNATYPLELKRPSDAKKHGDEDIGGWLMRVSLERRVQVLPGKVDTSFVRSQKTQSQWIEVIGHGELVAPDLPGHGVKADQIELEQGALSGGVRPLILGTSRSVVLSHGTKPLIPPGPATGHRVLERFVLLFLKAFDNAGSSSGLESEWRIPGADGTLYPASLVQQFPAEKAANAWVIDLEMRSERLIPKASATSEITRSKRVYHGQTAVTGNTVVVVRAIRLGKKPASGNDSKLRIAVLNAAGDKVAILTVEPPREGSGTDKEVPCPKGDEPRLDVAIQGEGTGVQAKWTAHQRLTTRDGYRAWEQFSLGTFQPVGPVVVGPTRFSVSVEAEGGSGEVFFVPPSFTWNLWDAIFPLQLSENDPTLREDLTARIIRALPIHDPTDFPDPATDPDAPVPTPPTDNSAVPERKAVKEFLRKMDPWTDWLWLDAAGRVLLGYRHEITDRSSAGRIKMKDSISQEPARPRQVEEYWRRVQEAPKGQDRDVYKGYGDLRFDFAPPQQGLLDDWLDKEIDESLEDLRKTFERYADFHFHARQALLDLRFTLGKREFHKRTKLKDAARAENWREVAAQSSRKDVSPYWNERVRGLLLSAAQ